MPRKWSELTLDCQKWQFWRTGWPESLLSCCQRRIRWTCSNPRRRSQTPRPIEKSNLIFKGLVQIYWSFLQPGRWVGGGCQRNQHPATCQGFHGRGWRLQEEYRGEKVSCELLVWIQSIFVGVSLNEFYFAESTKTRSTCVKFCLKFQKRNWKMLLTMLSKSMYVKYGFLSHLYLNLYH